MGTKTPILQRIGLYITALVLLAGYPISAMASTEEPTTPPSTTTETAPAPEPPKKPELTYTYNKDTGTWDSEKWQFNPQTGKYEAPPAPIIIEPKVEEKTSQEVNKDVETNVNVDNNVNSDATSGDSAVDGNTKGGNATTGDAAAVATLVNVVNSSVAAGGNEKVANFTKDIYGDVKGDIVLHPMLLKAMLEAQVQGNTSSTIDVKNNLQVNNNMDVNATSGNASVTKNGKAGNATSGSAHAVANVVNILNSMISTQQSFIGTINIYGNLEGDILIAPDFIPQMIANNGGNAADITVSSQDTQSIVNNISAAAESGAASVFGNTKGGDATSGSADTNVVIFNLSGHEIIAKNSLLVFVNVLGRWVGVIVDAPQGATAAMLGNGVSSHNYDPDVTINSESNQGITNTIAVTAQSGDATVAQNTEGGNATTGNAKAVANVANVTGSQIGTSDWFGVLFINVFEDWFGSFGVNTPYGDTPMQAAKPKPTGPIQFIPAAEKKTQPKIRMVVVDTRAYSTMDTSEKSNVVVNDTTIAEQSSSETTSDKKDVKGSQVIDVPFDYRLWVAAGSLLVIGAAAVGLRHLLR